MDLFRAVRKTRTIALCLGLLGATAQLEAQQPAGEIRLSVKDPSGAAVVVSGTLRNSATGATRVFETDTSGLFTLEDLPFGRYRLEVTKSGFAVESSLIDVRSAAPISRTVNMILATQASEIDVVAPTALPGT